MVINPVSFGYQLTVDVFCKVEPRQLQAVIEALMAMHEITYIVAATGVTDLSI